MPTHWHQRDIYIHICLCDENLPAAKDPVPPRTLVCMTLFGIVYVHVRAVDKYKGPI